MQINTRAISRLVRLGTRAFRAFQSSRKRDQRASPDQHRSPGTPGAGQGGQRWQGMGDGTGGG